MLAHLMETEVHRPTEDELRVFSSRIATAADRSSPGPRSRFPPGACGRPDAAGGRGDLLSAPRPAADRRGPGDPRGLRPDRAAGPSRERSAAGARRTGGGARHALRAASPRPTSTSRTRSAARPTTAGFSSKAWSAALGPGTEQRRDEVRDVAERYHKRALELIAKDDFYPAIELLREAVRISPQPELYALLGKLQAKNPRWLRVAAESLQQAMALGSRDPELPAALHDAQQRLAAGEWRATDPTTGMAPAPPAPARGRTRPTSRCSIRKRRSAGGGRGPGLAQGLRERRPPAGAEFIQPGVSTPGEGPGQIPSPVGPACIRQSDLQATQPCGSRNRQADQSPPLQGCRPSLLRESPSVRNGLSPSSPREGGWRRLGERRRPGR